MFIQKISASKFYNEVVRDKDYKIIIDCRNKEAYEKGHMKYAFSISSNSTDASINTTGCHEGYSMRMSILKNKRGFILYGDEDSSDWTISLAYLIKSQFLVDFVMIVDLDEIEFSYPFLLEGCTCNSSLTFPNEIIQPINKGGGLYLSGIIPALSLTVLKTLGITHIVDISKCGQSKRKFEENGIQYCTIDLDDLKNCNIFQYFESATNFIETAIKSHNGNVLVHCYAGISRSATIIMAYLMKSTNSPLVNVYDHVHSCRDSVHPNLGFKRQLQLWESIILGSKKPSFVPLSEDQLKLLPKSVCEHWPNNNKSKRRSSIECISRNYNPTDQSKCTIS
mmetsp:Transcript_10858/g.15394  ORF Transcript_10858/g.15394 Transcript_10858/m.15394 type:complete len:337 (-) Transcript_10858:35-1045(-)